MYCFYFTQLMHKYAPQHALFIYCSLLHVSPSLCHPQGVSKIKINMYIGLHVKYP